MKGAPSKNTIKRLYEKFSTGEALSNPKRPNKNRMHLFPYKIQLTQRLLPADKPRRLEWAQRVIEMAKDDDQFWNKIIMSDEAHFTLNGTVIKQNCH